MKLTLIIKLLSLLPGVTSFSAIAPKQNVPQSPFSTSPTVPLNTNNKNNYPYFTIIEEPSQRGATVLEAPVVQEGVSMYIALDAASFVGRQRPGNGGIRLLRYASTKDAVDDAVRLAKGMTRKHDMFRTGFSGGKVVVHSVLDGLNLIERQSLMQDAARALQALDDSMYTGCDLNTNDLDMDYLTAATEDKYVLAGRNSRVDTNVATAASVIGSVLGTVRAMGEGDLSHLTFTVQGCGKVGSVVARELVRLGAKRVQTCDLNMDAARSVEGCVPIEDWSSEPCDFLVPCANSLAITEEVAQTFPAGIRFCVGATNSPFADPSARSIFDQRGVMHIPESISSAGAILADSVEWYDKTLYQTVEPSLMYGWIRDLSRRKASDLIRGARRDPTAVEASLSGVVPPRDGDPVGQEFPAWIAENTQHTPTLIVGGGVAGTATAFSLADKFDRSSILVEQGATVAPSSGSSNGDSRMYRQMYSDAFFSRMQTQALGRWADVERLSDTTLLRRNGLLFYGEDDTGETVEGSVRGAREVMETLGLPHTYYDSGDEIARAYPALAGCRGKPYSGVYEETAGHIRASQACQAMVKAAGEHCDVKLNTKIVSLQTKDQPNNKVVAVTENGDTIVADNVVLACGAWTNAVLTDCDMPPLNLDIWQVQWAHYEVNTEDVAFVPQAFHFRKERDIDGGLYYVFPANATESVGTGGKSYVKVGVDFPTGDSLSDMSTFDYRGSPDVLALMDAWVQEHIPAAGPRLDAYCHPYTMTKDSYFVVDNLAPNVAIFTGGSGRAFKFGPLLGDCLASLLTKTESPVDLRPFAATRSEVTR